MKAEEVSRVEKEVSRGKKVKISYGSAYVLHVRKDHCVLLKRDCLEGKYFLQFIVAHGYFMKNDRLIWDHGDYFYDLEEFIDGYCNRYSSVSRFI